MGLVTGRPAIFVAAGEISGDLHAAHLARAIRRRCPGARLYGCGGDRMRAAGVEVRVDTAALGYVGLWEALRFRRPIRRARAAVTALLQRDRPDLAVLVDGERFNGFLVDLLHRQGVPTVIYMAPQVGCWGRWRIGPIARRTRLVIPAAPGDRELFRRKGARAVWLGHPLLDIVRPSAAPDAVLARHGLDGSLPLIGLLPGSRWQEIERFTPIVLAAARTLAARHPGMQFILPLAAPHLGPRLMIELEAAGLAERVRVLTDDVHTCLSCCRLALVASGTATLETALLGVPMVVFYSLHPVTYLAARLLVKSRFIAMPNILLGHAVVPELIQGAFTAERLVAEAEAILADPAHSAAIRRRLAEIPALLGRTGVLDAAARLVLAEATWQPAPAPALDPACTA